MRHAALVAVPLLLVAAPAAAQEQLACWSYADSALFVVSEAAKFNCGFTGPRWSSDYNLHYNFCMGGGPNNGVAVSTETNQRSRDLAECWARGTGTQAFQPQTPFENASQTFATTQSTFCQNYADTSTAQVEEGRRLGCGFPDDGGRWAFSYNLHRDACLGGFGGQNVGQIAASEIGARSWGLKECQVRLASAAPAPPAAPDPATPPEAAPAPAFTHIVVQDVDYYTPPSKGEGDPAGFLPAGTEVVATCGADQWCAVQDYGNAWGGNGEFIRER